jgi:hypothetical protein
MAQANTFAKRFPNSTYWPDRHWDLVLALDNSSQRTEYYDQLLERAAWFYEAVGFSAAMKSQTRGSGRRTELLHRQSRSLARWRRQLHIAHSGQPAGETVLVSHRLLRRHPVPDRQRTGAADPQAAHRLVFPGALGAAPPGGSVLIRGDHGGLHGTSTRKVDDLVKALGADSGISKSEVSRICADLDTEVSAFRDRPLADQRFPYVVLDATYCKARVNHRVVAQAVVIATGVAADGRREVLGFEVGDSEDGAFWTAFLRSLKSRGLAGVQLVISDAHSGLRAAIEVILIGASWHGVGHMNRDTAANVDEPVLDALELRRCCESAVSLHGGTVCPRPCIRRILPAIAARGQCSPLRSLPRGLLLRHR